MAGAIGKILQVRGVYVRLKSAASERQCPEEGLHGWPKRHSFYLVKAALLLMLADFLCIPQQLHAPIV